MKNHDTLWIRNPIMQFGFWRKILQLCMVTCVMVLLVATAHATTRNVPLEYANIQAAINAANSGDTIRVFAGTYTGPIDINKSLVVIGSWPDSMTVIVAP